MWSFKMQMRNRRYFLTKVPNRLLSGQIASKISAEMHFRSSKITIQIFINFNFFNNFKQMSLKFRQMSLKSSIQTHSQSVLVTKTVSTEIFSNMATNIQSNQSNSFNPFKFQPKAKSHQNSNFAPILQTNLFNSPKCSKFNYQHIYLNSPQ